MTSFFVTGSGTGVGKTVVTARLIRELRVGGRSVTAIKPVISGFTWHGLPHSDTGRLLQAMERDATAENVNTVSPWRFEEPLSPDMAAHREGRQIDYDALLQFSRDTLAGGSDVCLIEGVGGVMVPIDGSHLVADWIAELGIPSIVVVGSYLGTISHTLTTVETMRGRNLDIAAIIVSESEDNPVALSETVDAIRRFVTDIDVRPLPRMKYDESQPVLLADIVA